MDFTSEILISYKQNKRILQSSFKPTTQQLAIGYVGIIDLNLTNYGLDEVGLELGIYFFFMVLCMYALLDKTQGDPTEIKSYLAYRKLEIFHSQAVNTPRVQIILLIGGFVYLVYPFVALLVWFILNIIDRVALNYSVIPAISIILVGVSYAFTVQSFMTIQWNQFKFSPKTIVFVLLAVICLTIYQGLVIFGYDEDSKFLPYSSFFLIFNFIVISVFIFFDKYSDNKDLQYIMEKNFPKSGVAIDRKRDKILSEEIQAQRADPNWKCTFEDLIDFITMSQVSFETFQAMIGANIVQRFNQKGELYKNLIKYSLLFLACAILAVYGFILYRFDNDNKTGIIIAIAVTFLDVWTYFLALSEVIEQPIYIISFLLTNRVLLIGPGEWYWVYGIMILYLVYSIFFTYEIARKRFPSDDDVIKRKRTIQEIMKANKTQKSMLLKEKICQPELLFFIVNVIYIGLLFAIQFGEWQGKNIWPFIVNKGFSYQKVIGTGYLALLTAGIAFSVFLLIAYSRIARRKMTKTEKTSDYSEFFAHALEKTPRLKFIYRWCDQMLIFSFLIFLFSIGWMVISWWLMRDLSVFVWGICLPIMVFSYIRGLVHFHLNHYEVFEDVERLNLTIDNHNKKIEETEIKKVEIQKKIIDGTLFLQIENQTSNIQKKPSGIDSIECLTIDVNNYQEKNNKLIELMFKEEQRKKADDEEKFKLIKDDEELKKQEEEEKIKMINQINLEKEQLNKIYPNDRENIHEGGEPIIPDIYDKSDTQLIQKNPEENTQQVESDKIYLNLDEIEKLHNGYQQIAVSRLKKVTNWRILHENKWHKAFIQGDLRPNDYAFISSMFLAFFAWACLLGGLLGTTSGALGAVIVIPMAYLGVSYIIAASVLYQSRAFTWKELIVWIVLTVIYFGLSLAYFFLKFQVKNFKFTLNQRPPEQLDATYFLFFYVLCVPTAIHSIVCVIRIFERGFEGFLENFKYFIGIVILGLLLLVISCFLFVSAFQGAIFIASLMLVMFIIAQIFMYRQNGFAMTPFWLYFNSTIAFIMVFAPFIASFCTSTLTLYQGISMSTAIMVGILWIYALAHFLQDFSELKQRPIYFSQSLYPIYKFNDKTKDVEKHYMPIACWITGLVILMMWSLLTNTQVTPRWFGAFLTIVIEAIMILTLVQARTLSITTINDACIYMNDKVCKSAWLYTKECYFKQQTALKPSDILSYRRLWKQSYFVKQFGRCLEGRELIILPKDINEEIIKEITPPQDTTDLKSYFLQKIQEFEGSEKIDYEDIEDIKMLAILLQIRLDNTFLEELKQIIRFVMVTSSNSSAEKEAERKEFFRFLNEKKDILLVFGIRILIPQAGTIDSQFLSVMSQIEDLDEEHLEVFREVEKLSQEEAKRRKENQVATSEAEKKRQEERDKLQEELNKQRQEELRLFNEKLIQEQQEREKLQAEAAKKKQEELRQLIEEISQKQNDVQTKVQADINKKIQETLHKQIEQLSQNEIIEEQKDSLIKVVNKKIVEKIQAETAKKKQEELRQLMEEMAQFQKDTQTKIQAELYKKIEEQLHQQIEQLSQKYQLAEKNLSKILDDVMMSRLKEEVIKRMFSKVSMEVIIQFTSKDLNKNMNYLRSSFLDKAKVYAQSIVIIKSTDGKEFGFYVPYFWENTEKQIALDKDFDKNKPFAFQFEGSDLKIYQKWIHPQKMLVGSNDDEFLSVCMGQKSICITANIKSSEQIGHNWKGEILYDDLELLNKNFQTTPQISQIDIYADHRFIYGYEVIYKSNQDKIQLNQKDSKNDFFKAGLHIGTEKSDQLKCKSLKLQEGEFITGLSIWNTDFINRLEFQTNQRIFEVGQPKNQIDDTFTYSKVEGNIIALKGGIAWYLYNLKVYYTEDLWFQASSIEVFGIIKQKDPDDTLIDINADLDKMPDCILKYKTIVKRAQERNEKFVDKQFVAGDQALGPETAKEFEDYENKKWVRVSEQKREDEQTYTIFKDGANYQDIQQGSLGTCYFLSALAVLSNQQTKNLFVFLNSEEEFFMCGAFCVKFQLGGEETIIIIDDFFFQSDYTYQQFAFAQAINGELWPMIIEKAYAKLYGRQVNFLFSKLLFSHDKISGGFMQSALSELIPGFPICINHSSKPQNQLWNDLLKYYKLGCPLGAGSPSHPEGDRAKSDTGIVQGHAYSMLKVVEVDQIKFVCMRNPWGSSEWKGDWCDESEKWNKRIKNLVGFEGVKDDGLFWMDFNDYIKEFEDAYICIDLSGEKGWNQLKINDKWVGNQEQKKSKKGNKVWPQYGLKITKPGIAYLVFRLHDSVNNYESAVYGTCEVLANKGKIIEANSQRDRMGSVGPSNQNQNELELNFPAKQTYPYTYTIIASFEQGNKIVNEPSFSIRVFTQDSDATLVKLN